MSTHNAWEFAKKGLKWGAIIGIIMFTLPALFSLNPVLIAGAILTGAWQGGLTGVLLGGLIGAFTKDKESDFVQMQTSDGRSIVVPAKEVTLSQEMAQETSKFREMVASHTRGGMGGPS